MRTLAPALFGLVALLLLPLLTGPTPAWSEEEEAKPESEMWKRLKARDADGDGAIRRDEFPGRDRMWNRLDADGDGVVTREEADKASTGRRGRGQGGGPGGPGGRSGRGAMGAPRGGLRLEALDTDKNGSISQAEWAAFFAKADENGDDILQKEEWESAAAGKAFQDQAPKVGASAPKVSAKARLLGTPVDLAAPKRTTVLIFGSWT